MPVGYHHFYAFPRVNPWDCNREDYFLGGFVGDPFNDEAFKIKLERINAILKRKLGFPNYQVWWSPENQKPYSPRTNAQRLATAIKKAGNKTARKIKQLQNDNCLFVDEFIKEENEKLSKCQDVLRNRYTKN